MLLRKLILKQLDQILLEYLVWAEDNHEYQNIGSLRKFIRGRII